ncbi:hypothetical protein ACFWP7_32255 [Streptomyces sp. NPDC058470]|uniref:hypothetical protein n=1 Tax=Streptomyces sp. NPDC058470 TaxID=3346515 RepID=UPI00364A53AA
MAGPRCTARRAAPCPATLAGWIFGLVNWLDPVASGLPLVLYGLVLGAPVGAPLGLLMHAAQCDRRDFATVSFMQPGRYDIVADKAVRLLAEVPSGTDTSSGVWKSSRPRSGPAVT